MAPKETSRLRWWITARGSTLPFCHMSSTVSINPATRAEWDWAYQSPNIWWKHMGGKSGRKAKWGGEQPFRLHFQPKCVVKYHAVISARKASFHAYLSCLSETQNI